MSSSRQHIISNPPSVRFDPNQLGAELAARFPKITFAFLMGSSATGIVVGGADIDLAVYLSEEPKLELYLDLQDTVNLLVPGVRADIGILNSADPVYRFEALKGRLLFLRDPQIYQDFYSRTCREYEMQLADYERQFRYRREAARSRQRGLAAQARTSQLSA